jgi:hypothetical protein
MPKYQQAEARQDATPATTNIIKRNDFVRHRFLIACVFRSLMLSVHSAALQLLSKYFGSLKNPPPL